MGNSNIPDGYTADEVNGMKGGDSYGFDGGYDSYAKGNDAYGFCDVETRPYPKHVVPDNSNYDGCMDTFFMVLMVIIVVAACSSFAWFTGYIQGNYQPSTPDVPAMITATPTVQVQSMEVYPEIRYTPKVGLYQTVNITGVTAEQIKSIGYSWKRGDVEYNPMFCSGVIECYWERPLVADAYFIVVSVGNVVHYFPADAQAQYVTVTISN